MGFITKILSVIVCVWLHEYTPTRYNVYAFAVGAVTSGIIFMLLK